MILVRYQQKQTWPVERASFKALGRDHLPLAVVEIRAECPRFDVVGLVGLAVGALAFDLDDLDVVIPPLSLDGGHSLLGLQIDFLGLRNHGRGG